MQCLQKVRGSLLYSILSSISGLIDVIIFDANINKDILGNQGSMAHLIFQAPLGVDASIIICEWSHDGDTILIDGNKYVQPGPRSLQIYNIVGEDEGVYTCNYNYSQQRFSETVACINVIGISSIKYFYDCVIIIFFY